MKTLKELDKELVKIKNKAYDPDDSDYEYYQSTIELLDLSESLIDLLNKPDERPKIFKEWMEGYFQFYLDNGSVTSIAIVREVEKKFKEVFGSDY